MDSLQQLTMEQTFKGKINDFQISDLEKNAFYDEYKIIVNEDAPYFQRYQALNKIGTHLHSDTLSFDAIEILQKVLIGLKNTSILKTDAVYLLS